MWWGRDSGRGLLVWIPRVRRKTMSVLKRSRGRNGGDATRSGGGDGGGGCRGTPLWLAIVGQWPRSGRASPLG